MLYKGKANCIKHGEFEWQIFEGEKNQIIIGKDLKTKFVKKYNKELGLVIANCPVCGCDIEITNYKFDRN